MTCFCLVPCCKPAFSVWHCPTPTKEVKPVANHKNTAIFSYYQKKKKKHGKLFLVQTLGPCFHRVEGEPKSEIAAVKLDDT
jgi:hypothetical protein